MDNYENRAELFTVENQNSRFEEMVKRGVSTSEALSLMEQGRVVLEEIMTEAEVVRGN